MTLTLFGLTLAPLYLSMVLQPKDGEKMMKELSKNEGLRLTLGFLMLVFGAFTLASTGVEWVLDWNHLLMWLGVLVMLKGAAYILLPGLIQNQVKKWATAKMLPLGGFIGLLLVLGLIYVDMQVL